MISTNQSTFRRSVIGALLLFSGELALAEPAISIGNAWVRSTVPAQTTTGAYMDITSASAAKLIGATTPVADVEIHQMTMNKGIMKMREINALPLPAKKPVSLAAGGYHMMLSNLKKPLKKGEVVALSLIIESTSKKKSTIKIVVPVRDEAP